MKKTILLLAFLLVGILVNAQKKQNTYYLKNNGKEVELKDSADYIRVIQEPDSGETNYVVQEFYANGKRKLVGKVSAFEPRLVYEGSVLSFHENGLKKSVITYLNNMPIGKAYHFFEDGKLQKELEYIPKELGKNKSTAPSFVTKFKLIYQVDSLGTVYVKEGNGHLIEYTKTEKDSLIEEGDYKDGFKEGVWKGRYVSGKSSYVESYSATKFVSGVNTVGDKIFEYTILESPPDYKGGIQSFYRYLANAIRYPNEELKLGISGKVLVNFTIEKDGKVTDVKVDKPVYPSFDNEAIRVVKASSNWIPGMQRGLPVRVKYNIPINFDIK